MANFATIKKKRVAPTGFVWLSPGLMRRLNTDRVALYLCSDDSNRAVLYRQAGEQQTEPELEELFDSQGEHLCIRAADFKDACADLMGSLGDLVSDESMSPGDRFQMLQVAVSFEVERTLKAVDPGQYVALSANVAKHITSLVTATGLLPDEMFAIARHDAQTFTHVTNTAGYTVMLAERLGYTDEEELMQIAMGAMLHDIGKRRIPRHILAKPGSLTREERAVVQTHPLRGYEELAKRSDVTEEQRLMVYQHHERMDGTGYPVRILGGEIHPWARMLSVVDVFEALTGSRPYRKPMTLHEAADHVASRAGTQLDKEMVECWIAALNCP